eukprot:11053112-Alexandrium_andersonii.AAC.1
MDSAIGSASCSELGAADRLLLRAAWRELAMAVLSGHLVALFPSDGGFRHSGKTRESRLGAGGRQRPVDQGRQRPVQSFSTWFRP